MSEPQPVTIDNIPITRNHFVLAIVSLDMLDLIDKGLMKPGLFLITEGFAKRIIKECREIQWPEPNEKEVVDAVRAITEWTQEQLN